LGGNATILDGLPGSSSLASPLTVLEEEAADAGSTTPHEEVKKLLSCLKL
jgi:hypothetical protein